jgi:aminocarboxymuconate-semialdehyde decarboxylase
VVVADVHAHVIVPEVLRDAVPWGPRVYREGGAQVVELDGRPIRSAVDEFCDLDGILATADAAGIDHVLLSPWVPLLFGEADPVAAAERARVQNAGLERLVRERPDRVSALGAVPLQEPELAAAELRDVMGTLRGVEVPASVGGDPLGHERFAPFWAAAEETGALVFVHPTTRGFQAPAFGDFYLWNTVGNPFETTITAAHLVLAGVLERHPRLRIVLAHGGGAVLGLRGRLRHAHSFQPQARAALRDSPEASLRRFYYDTVTHDADVLRALVEFAGADHVLLGTDHPFDMADARPVDTVRAAGLSASDERLVLGENLMRLLGRDVTSEAVMSPDQGDGADVTLTGGEAE